MKIQFEIGDRVIISTVSEYYSKEGTEVNPNVPGTISMIREGDYWGLHIVVEWDNGEWNSYASEDLTLVK